MASMRLRAEEALREAVRDNQLQEVIRLIAAGTNVDARKYPWERFNALSTASCEGHTKLVRTLLAAGADINLQDVGGRTALMEAILYRHIATVRVLLAAGADINIRRAGGRTALLLATQANCNYVTDAIVDAIIDAHLAQIRESISPAPVLNQHQAAVCHRRRQLVISELPEDIYHCIQEFAPINALLNTSRRLADVKRRLYCWNLNVNYSLLYYLSAEYRQFLVSNGRFLHDSCKQLVLDFKRFNKTYDWRIQLSEDVVNELSGSVLRIDR